MPRTKLLEIRTKRDKETASSISLSTSARMTSAFRSARILIPFIKSTGVLVLMLWALLTLSNWARDDAALDYVPRIAMNDFAVAYKQAYLKSAKSAGTWPHGLHILDVRMGSTYIEGHIPGAISLPEGDVEMRIRYLVPDTMSEIVVYCG